MTHVCRGCYAPLNFIFADLGRSPPSNSFRPIAQADRPEYTLPLRVYVCERCKLVQLPEFEGPENIFSDYMYFSSYSPTWVEHNKRFAQSMVDAHGLGPKSLVVEVASNDGYLLEQFDDLGVPVLGVDPAANVAAVAAEKGVPTIVAFFNRNIALEIVTEYGKADLIHAANVLAHVPNIHDFVAGFTELLKPGGTITFEFPHLCSLISNTQLDTIYHEHYSYLSLLALEPIFKTHGLRVCYVEFLSTHGGSLRLHLCHIESNNVEHRSVSALRIFESRQGLHDMWTYDNFQDAAFELKRALVDFLYRRKKHGDMVVGYGAPAKATTLLNYCGIDVDLLQYTVDATPAKQGKYIPGTHIPIYAEEELFKGEPDYVLIFPWNLAPDLIEKAKGNRVCRPHFFTAVPRLHIHT
jgi:SAM-dependent methyltransferase